MWHLMSPLWSIVQCPVPLLRILSANQYELAFIAQHRIDSNDFVLVRCHFRLSSQANANVLKCSKHSYWPCESKPIRIASFCIVERRINSCQFLLVRIWLLYIRIDSLYIRTRIRRLSAATQYVVIRCATIALSTGSHIFSLVPASS